MSDFDYSIGGHLVRLPEGHALPKTQANHRRYDLALGELASIVSGKYPGTARIDFGANVGDSLALMNKYVVADTLLIEGDPVYMDLLKFNLQRLGHPAKVCNSFCGTKISNISGANIGRVGGTSSILDTTGGGYQKDDKAENDRAEISVFTFEQIMEQYPEYKDAKLIKLDTDGCDFEILRVNAARFAEMQATLFYECAPYVAQNGLKNGIRESLQSFAELAKYFSKFLVYDNYGHFMCSLEGADLQRKYLELMVYNISNFVDEKRGPQVFYFDIAAFTEDNSDLYQQLAEFEIRRFFGKYKL